MLRELTSRGQCGLGCPSRTSERGGEGDCGTREEPGCCLLLQHLIQSCACGGRRIVENMCSETRRAEHQEKVLCFNMHVTRCQHACSSSQHACYRDCPCQHDGNFSMHVQNSNMALRCWQNSNMAFQNSNMAFQNSNMAFQNSNMACQHGIFFPTWH